MDKLEVMGERQRYYVLLIANATFLLNSLEQYVIWGQTEEITVKRRWIKF